MIKTLKLRVRDKHILVQQSPSSITMVEYTPLNGKYIDYAFNPEEMIDLQALQIGLSPHSDFNNPCVRMLILGYAEMHYIPYKEN